MARVGSQRHKKKPTGTSTRVIAIQIPSSPGYFKLFNYDIKQLKMLFQCRYVWFTLHVEFKTHFNYVRLEF